MGMFLSQLGALEDRADFLLFDTSAGLDNRVVTFLKEADEIIIVTTPDPSSVTDAYATVKVASHRAQGKPVSVIVNMASSQAEAGAVFRTLSDVAMRFLGTSLSYLGMVPMDPAAAFCVRNRRPFILSAPDCPASRALMEIAEILADCPSSLAIAA